MHPTDTHAQLIDPLNVHVVAHWDEHPIMHKAGDVWADDRGYAYVGNRLGSDVDIMNISDPTKPFLEATFTPPFIPDGPISLDVKYADGLIFVGFSASGGDILAQIVDVRDPANPQWLTNVSVPGFGDIHNSFYYKGYWYVVDSHTPQIGIFDLTEYDPDNAPESISTLKWHMQNVGGSFVHDISIMYDRMYVSAWQSGVWIYDVHNIADAPPTFIANAPGNKTHAAWGSHDGRWIITDEERSDGGPIKLYELTEDDSGVSLEHVFTYAIPTTHASSSHNVYIVGNRVYCAWYNRGLMAFDIVEDFKALRLVAHYDTSIETENFGGAFGVYPFLGRDKVLLSDKESQFWIFDVRVPGSGDFDGDADLDVRDYGGFQKCITLDGESYVAPDCEIMDMDQDSDVDLDDYWEFSTSMTGSK